VRFSSNTNAFTGRELDETGIYYYRARYYSPQIGRFISEDPIGFWGGINIYSYVDDDPANSTDPQGLRPYREPRPCNSDEYSKCAASCASQGKGVQSCRVAQTWRWGVKNGRMWGGWTDSDAAVSCSCTEPKNSCGAMDTLKNFLNGVGDDFWQWLNNPPQQNWPWVYGPGGNAGGATPVQPVFPGGAPVFPEGVPVEPVAVIP